MSSLVRAILACTALLALLGCAAGVVPIPVPVGTVTVPDDDDGY
jgi:hypothetical protein